MPHSLSIGAPLLTGAILLAAAANGRAQSTVPHWSTYFGGSGRDEIVAIRRGPGNLITIVGHTTSNNLPVTAGAMQPTFAGVNDAFVARFDPGLPPAQQLQWCTYCGGSALELVFDAEVDATTGITTVVGLTQSTNFPAPNALSGPSDGFVVQLAPTGSSLVASMLVGGSAHDRICDVEIEPNGLVVTVAGVTETQLPAQWTLNTVWPTYQGGATDAFVARVDPPSQQVQWATHVGGGSTEGIAFANWGGLGVVWEGNLDRMALAVDSAGQPVLATVSGAHASLAQTYGNLVQPSHGGAADVYLAIVSSSGSSCVYGSFLGGLLDDRPRAIAMHPSGGFVVGGLSFSTNFPTTPNGMQIAHAGGSTSDGVICHVDPYATGAALRYSSYFGGLAGADNVLDLAVETSGRVTFAGYTDGGIPTTPRRHQDFFGAAQQLGFVARVDLTLPRPDALLYSTLVGGQTATVLPFNSLVLDDVGDVLVAGAVAGGGYPLVNPWSGTFVGREGAFTHLPLLAGPVFRDGLSFANPACNAPLYTGAGSAPVPGATFLVTATNAPPNGLGILVLGDPVPPLPLPLPFNGTLLVNLMVTPTVLADPRGGAGFPIPVPLTAPLVASWNLAAQWFFLTGPSCPGTGPFANSERLNF